MRMKFSTDIHSIPDIHFLNSTFDGFKNSTVELDLDIQCIKRNKNFFGEYSNGLKYQTAPKYTFNSDGFRCDNNLEDINWDNTYVLVGCSHAFCQGVNDDETIVHFLKQNHGINVVSLGIPGASNKQIHTNAIAAEKLLKPKGVIILWTYSNRWTWVHDYELEKGNWLFETGHPANLSTRKFKELQQTINLPKQFGDVFNYDILMDYKLHWETHKLLGHYQYDVEGFWRPNNEKALWKMSRNDQFSEYERLHRVSYYNEFELKNTTLQRTLYDYFACDFFPNGKNIELRHFGKRINEDIAIMINNDIKI